jgi:RNA polymerase sigma-70 factor (ECF subfamily)
VYSVTARAAILRQLGLSAPEIQQILMDFRNAGLSTQDLALLDFCLKLGTDGNSNDARDVATLRSIGFEDVAILEAVLACALARMLTVLSAGVGAKPDFEPLQASLPSTVRKRPARDQPIHGSRGPYIQTQYLSPTDFPPFARTLKALGFIPNLYRALSLRPDVLEVQTSGMTSIIVTGEGLTRVQRESIFVAASAAILNSYCVAAHCNLLRGHGLSPDESDQIAFDYRQANLPEPDKKLLDFTVKLAARPFEVTAADIDQIRGSGFTDESLLLCISLTAYSNFLNIIRMGLGVEPDFDLPPGFEQKKLHLPQAEARPSKGDEAAPVRTAAEDPDASNVVRAQAGDLDAFESLVRQHSSAIYRTLVAILGNPEEAQDAMQDTLFSAFKHLGGFQGRSKFSTWLTSIARNAALQRLRSRKNMESLDESAGGDEEFRPRQIRDWQDDPEKSHSKEEIRKLVEKGIMALPAKYRVVVMLRDIEQIPTEDVARQLGLTVPAMKTRLLRGRLMLRESLAPHFTTGAGKAAV